MGTFIGRIIVVAIAYITGLLFGWLIRSRSYGDDRPSGATNRRVADQDGPTRGTAMSSRASSGMVAGGKTSGEPGSASSGGQGTYGAEGGSARAEWAAGTPNHDAAASDTRTGLGLMGRDSGWGYERAEGVGRDETRDPAERTYARRRELARSSRDALNRPDRVTSRTGSKDTSDDHDDGRSRAGAELSSSESPAAPSTAPPPTGVATSGPSSLHDQTSSRSDRAKGTAGKATSSGDATSGTDVGGAGGGEAGRSAPAGSLGSSDPRASSGSVDASGPAADASAGSDSPTGSASSAGTGTKAKSSRKATTSKAAAGKTGGKSKKASSPAAQDGAGKAATSRSASKSGSKASSATADGRRANDRPGQGSATGSAEASSTASGLGAKRADAEASTAQDTAQRAGVATSKGSASSAKKGKSSGAKSSKSRSAAPSAPAASASGDDDLKQIRGIGPLNETRLHEAGVTSFAQIAAWTPEEAAAMGERLSFGGRIERENWVEQARTLADGGETDFAKRVRAGRVRTSLERDDPRYSED